MCGVIAALKDPYDPNKLSFKVWIHADACISSNAVILAVSFRKMTEYSHMTDAQKSIQKAINLL